MPDDRWLSLSVGQMVPEIDPNNPGAIASLIRDKTNEIEGRLQQTLSAANNVVAASSALLGQANTVAGALKGAQSALSELAGNVGNKGVYFRLLGICPNFPQSLLRSSQELASEVARVLTPTSADARQAELTSALGTQTARRNTLREILNDEESSLEQRNAASEELQGVETEIQGLQNQLEQLKENEDPCTPNFVGDTAYVGGMLIVTGAPNPLALWDKLKVLAEIFPGIKSVISDGIDRFKGIGESVGDFLENFKPERFEQLAADFQDFRESLAALEESPFFNLDEAFQTNGCDKWSCSRLKDVMPFLNVDLPGSAMNLAVDFSSSVTDTLANALQRISGLQNTAARLTAETGNLQSNINAFKNGVFEFADNLAATGVYVRSFGRNGTLRNNQDLINAARNAIFDTSDPGRPTFRGDTAVVAGVLLVFGGPDVSALGAQFQAIGKAIKGFDGSARMVSDASSQVASSFKALREATSTSEVDPAFKVNPTAPQRGGTSSSLLDALGIPTPTTEGSISNIDPTQVSAPPPAAYVGATAVPTAQLVVKTDPNTGLQSVETEPAEVPIADSVSEEELLIVASQAPSLEGETKPLPDSYVETENIAGQLRVAEALAKGLS